ncbi:hypothetical protein ACET3Z_015903 [Daucus carota]
MGGQAQKKARSLPQEFGDEDRISRLPDELIHKILSFVDAKEAVQTSVLSRRWELIWTTLPFLSFCGYEAVASRNVCKFMRHFLSNRNHQSKISDLNLCVKNKGFTKALVDKYVKYAISHNVRSLTLELSYDDKLFKLSAFSSNSIRELTLKVRLEELNSSNYWHWSLPSLTTLHLKCLSREYKVTMISKSWFRCLPALTTLRLDDWLLSKSSFSFRLPALTTLCLSHTTLPEKSWKEFSNLLSLQLEGEDIPHNINDILSALVCLQNLTLCLSSAKVHFISCPPQLLNLSIRTSFRHHSYGCSNIVVSAAKLCNFTSFGIFTATIGVPELENVNIRLREWFESWLDNIDLERKKQNYRRLINLLPGLNYAKNLTFDLKSIEVLNEISSLLVGLPSPFFKLKHVKLPRGFEESTISCALRSYLLGGSPNATFVTKLPQSGTEGRWGPVGAQDPIMHSGCRSILMNNGVEDCMIDADRFRHNNASVEGADKDQASSLRGKRDSGLWRSYENNGVEDFMVDVDRARADDAKVKLLDLLACVDDAKVKLHDKQTLRMEKLSEIEKAFGTKSTNLLVGCIGDDLLSNP